MLKKVAGLICLFSIFMLYAFNATPRFNVEITYGKKSNCIVQNVLIATFYDSVSATLTRDFNYDVVIEKTQAKLQFVEEVDGIKSYYYYSKKLAKNEVVKEVKVNLQIAVSSNYIKIGSPIIYGGF